MMAGLINSEHSGETLERLKVMSLFSTGRLSQGKVTGENGKHFWIVAHAVG
jgi:hypothetical protein